MTSSIKRVDKGWGYELWIANKPEYCGKLLFFNQGKKCSWHYHKIKDETFFLQSGELMVHTSDEDDINNADLTVMHPGDSLYIRPGLRHQMYAIQESELFEFSTEHFDADSYRIERGD
jgi:quercetin dioxygenase-like cupin family protein